MNVDKTQQVGDYTIAYDKQTRAHVYVATVYKGGEEVYRSPPQSDLSSAKRLAHDYVDDATIKAWTDAKGAS